MDNPIKILESLRQQWADRLGMGDSSEQDAAHRIPPELPARQAPPSAESLPRRPFFGPPPGAEEEEVPEVAVPAMAAPLSVPPAVAPRRRAAGPPPQLWSLALQGGGPLGSFTWGVLERILEDGGIMPAALSGASAGAVNACVLASHWTSGGADAACAALERVWHRISDAANFPPFGVFPLMPKLAADMGSTAFDMMTRAFSPYQFNPLDRNPLRDILEDEIDIEALRDRHCPRLFISATRVGDGACRIFTNETITPDAILASATLPLLHQAVEIDGEFYWDGGYTANPPIRPLANGFRHLPILLIELMPAQRATELPVTAQQINERLNHIIFSRHLFDELRAISERPAPPHIERLTITRLPENQTSLDWRQLLGLRAQGRDAAQAWIEARRQPASSRS